MELLCPEIERLVSCYSCGTQALPPYRLCLEAHVGCPPCAKYLPQCACGFQFSTGPHSTFDWLVSAMKLRCKYASSRDERAISVDGGNGEHDNGNGSGGGDEDCENRWFGVQELQEHYRTSCTKNSYMCPLPGCSHVARIDTIVDHYEVVHGPFLELTSDDVERPYEVTFTIPSSPQESVHKIFNGYFLFIVSPPEHQNTLDPLKLSMQNINPADPIRYMHDAVTSLIYNEFKVKVTMLEMYYEH